MKLDNSKNKKNILEYKMNWETRSIKSLCIKVTSGGTPSRKNPAFYENGIIPWLKTKELKDWYIDDSEEKITLEALKNSSAKMFPQNTVLMAMYGDGKTITSMGILRIEAATNQACCALITNPEVCDHLFLFYSLKFHRKDFISMASGGSQRNLNGQLISNFTIKVPCLKVQKKIAYILSCHDFLIENNTRRIEILEQMAKLIYEEWFVKFRFPGHENVKMVPSDLGEIPEGWEVKKLPDFCSKVIDGTHDSPKPSENGYFLVTGKHIINGFINFSECYLVSPDEHAKVIQRSKPEKGDIIFSNIGTLGSTVLVDQDFEFSIKNVALFKPLEDFYSSYLYLHFSSPETYNQMVKKASGTSQKFFSLNFLRNLDLMEPPKDLLHKFDKMIKPLIEERSLLNKKNQNLCKTRDLLLPKLISGEIDVSDLDICIKSKFQES